MTEAHPTAQRRFLLAAAKLRFLPAAAVERHFMPDAAELSRFGPEAAAQRRFMLAAAALLLAFVALAAWIWPATLDDAFISYRYAGNWVRGLGLVFNSGERVEGYSNPLWILLLAPGMAAGLDPEPLSKLLGLACGALTILLTMHLARRHFRLSRRISLLAGAWLATSVGMLYYAISGLETPLYTLLLLVMAKMLLEHRFGAAAMLSAAMLITRPEGMLTILPLALCAWAARRQVQGWWRWPLLPLAGLLLVTAWRWLYYQALVPNTFNAKIKTQWDILQYALWHTQTFINYAWRSFAWNDLVPFFALFYLLFMRRRRDLAPLSLLGILLFFIWFSGSDWMSFGRFYVPTLPLLALFAAAAMQQISAALAGRGFHRKRLVLWLALPIVVNLTAFYYAAEELQSGQSINPAMHSRPHRAVGEWLRQNTQPGEKLAVNEIGAIGYYSGLTIIDVIGLTDKRIPPYWKRGDWEGLAGYVLAQRPRYIALNDRQSPADAGMDPLHLAIYNRMQQEGGYRLWRQFALKEGKNLLLFAHEEP